MEDLDEAALKTILRIMQRREADGYMQRLKPKPPERSVEAIVASTVKADEDKSDGDGQ